MDTTAMLKIISYRIKETIKKNSNYEILRPVVGKDIENKELSQSNIQCEGRFICNRCFMGQHQTNQSYWLECY